MENSSPDPAPASRDQVLALNRRLALIQGAVFAWIAVCAVAAMQLANSTIDSAPPRNWTVAGVALAVGAVSLRRFSTSPVVKSPTRVILGTLALLLAAGVAACGLGIAWNAGPRSPALAFSLGAALLALRRPSIAVPSAFPEER